MSDFISPLTFNPLFSVQNNTSVTCNFIAVFLHNLAVEKFVSAGHIPCPCFLTLVNGTQLVFMTTLAENWFISK